MSKLVTATMPAGINFLLLMKRLPMTRNRTTQRAAGMMFADLDAPALAANCALREMSAPNIRPLASDAVLLDFR
ncbi:hypothetical protein IW146_003861 [Coemansia sp. RSA 922]|nr:hypothetical protein GGI09_006024 [Coemansia sp. S100]KAJ2113449.1 hypothetical protein IW146_003861 [Coemansia sp. RSA 922]